MSKRMSFRPTSTSRLLAVSAAALGVLLLTDNSPRMDGPRKRKHWDGKPPRGYKADGTPKRT